MRFIVGNIEQARSKAKFLQRSLKRFDIERSLTQCQGYLASAFGFSSWAEMKTVLGRSSLDTSDTKNDKLFSQMVSQDFETNSIVNIYAHAIFARMGYCQSIRHFDIRSPRFYQEFIEPSETATALEMVFERYLEIGYEGDEVDALIEMAQLLIAPYIDVHPASFALNGMIFIDQMKACRNPNRRCLYEVYFRELAEDCLSRMPSKGAFRLGGDPNETMPHVIALMKGVRKAAKFTMPLKWLVYQKGSIEDDTILYLPVVMDGSKSVLDRFAASHRILVANNAPVGSTAVLSDYLTNEGPGTSHHYSIISGPSQERIDMTISAYVEKEISRGGTVSFYGNKRLSNRMGTMALPSDRFWNAQNEHFSWFKEDHPIHDNPELKFWAHLRDEPSMIVVQDFADRGRFPNNPVSQNREDVLGDAFVTGHSGLTGILANDPNEAIEIFVSGITKPWYYEDENAEKIRFMYDGIDYSEKLRQAIAVKASDMRSATGP